MQPTRLHTTFCLSSPAATEPQQVPVLLPHMDVLYAWLQSAFVTKQLHPAAVSTTTDSPAGADMYTITSIAPLCSDQHIIPIT